MEQQTIQSIYRETETVREMQRHGALLELKESMIDFETFVRTCPEYRQMALSELMPYTLFFLPSRRRKNNPDSIKRMLVFALFVLAAAGQLVGDFSLTISYQDEFLGGSEPEMVCIHEHKLHLSKKVLNITIIPFACDTGYSYDDMFVFAEDEFVVSVSQDVFTISTNSVPSVIVIDMSENIINVDDVVHKFDVI